MRQIFLDRSEKEDIKPLFNAAKLSQYYRALRREEFDRLYSIYGIIKKKVLITDVYNFAVGEKMRFLEENTNHFMDISFPLIKKSYIDNRLMHNKCFFTVGNATNIPYKNNVFDVVVSESTLDHMPFSGLSTALDGLYKVLKKGGYLFLTLNNRYDFMFVISALLDRLRGKNVYPEVFYNIHSIQSLLCRKGFSVLMEKYLFEWLTWKVLTHCLRSIIKKGENKTECILSDKNINTWLWKKLRKYISPQFIVVAKK